MMYNVHKNQYLMWFIRFDKNIIRFQKRFSNKTRSPIFFRPDFKQAVELEAVKTSLSQCWKQWQNRQTQGNWLEKKTKLHQCRQWDSQKVWWYFSELFRFLLPSPFTVIPNQGLFLKSGDFQWIKSPHSAPPLIILLIFHPKWVETL